MRSSCVAGQKGRSVVRSLFATAIAALVILAMCIPEAEAARRKKRKVGGYSPPYASIVYDVNSGRVLQETHSTALRHPASVTKVMTLYMLFEQMERGKFTLESELPVSGFASRQAPSKLGLKPGETISVEDAIMALVTKSANDVAVVVAEAIGGSEERFGQMMTAKARSIGMTQSVFRNASGLPNPQQVTTARDLATLGKAVHDRFPKQYAYFSTRSFSYGSTQYRNHNRLLGQIEGVDGIKTGYTRASGFNLLTSAKTEGRHIITVVLGGRSGRARDVQVAALVGEHMPRAVAGRRTARTVEVATVDAEVEAPAPLARQPQRVALAAIPAAPPAAEAPAARPSSLPMPPSRPRTAVIAETGYAEPGLTKARPLALAASGSTRIAPGATNPLALVGTTPRSPAQRAAFLDTQSAQGNRLMPPGSVRYTNSTPTTAIIPDEAQPLPTTESPAIAAAKLETRLGITPARPATEPASKSVETAPLKETIPAKDVIPARTTPAPAPNRVLTAVPPAQARSGWVIQLAAAESEGKARLVLENARVKSGGLLKQAEPFTEAVTKGASTLFRARFAGFDADEAQAACKALKRNGFNCFAQKI